MTDWLGSSDQYVLDTESHFPEPRNTVRPSGYQSDEPIRMPPRSVGTFEGKYLAENQGIPTWMCRCPKCRNYYYGPSVPRPLRTETVDERDRRMYMNRCRPDQGELTIMPSLAPAPSQKMSVDANTLLIMFLFIVVIFIACAMHMGVRIHFPWSKATDD